ARAAHAEDDLIVLGIRQHVWDIDHGPARYRTARRPAPVQSHRIFAQGLGRYVVGGGDEMHALAVELLEVTHDSVAELRGTLHEAGLTLRFGLADDAHDLGSCRLLL